MCWSSREAALVRSLTCADPQGRQRNCTALTCAGPEAVQVRTQSIAGPQGKRHKGRVLTYARGGGIG